MVEKRRPSQKDYAPLKIKPSNKQSKLLAKQNELLDQILIGQGATPTDDGRINLQEKMGHMSAHRS